MMMLVEKKQGTWELGSYDNGEGDSLGQPSNRGELVGDKGC